MKRILFVAFGFKGEINQRIPVVQRLQAMGHHVWWLSPLGVPDDQLASVGIEIVAIPPSLQPRGSLSGEARARIVEDEEAVRVGDRMLYVDGVPELVSGICEKIRALQPDLVVLDGTIYAAVIASHLESVPFANVSAGWMLRQPATLDYPMMDRIRALSAERAALFARYDLAPEFRGWEVVSPLLNIIFTTPEMVGVDSTLPPVHLVGPSVSETRRGDEPSFAWQSVDGRPLVYASFGSRVYWQPSLFRRIAEAAAALHAQVLFSAGDLAQHESMHGLPGNPIVTTYVPQLAVLARTAAFVTHAGANSVSEAMYEGVPLLALPICNEEPVQAHFVERAGVGISLDPRSASVSEIRDALRALLEPASAYRTRARAVQRSYHNADGARAAAQLLIAACGRD